MKKLLMMIGVALTSVVMTAKGGERVMTYSSDGKAFVVVNGSNRYTRALYGGSDVFRLETSDRPIFATFNNCHNIQFSLEYKGNTVNLDATDYCRSAYYGGRRDYTLTHSSWEGGKVEIATIACRKGKGAIWRFTTEGFNEAPTITMRTCETEIKKMPRNGDIGKFYKEGSYEAAKEPKELKTAQWKCSGNEITYAFFDNNEIQTGDALAEHFNADDSERQRLASSITFTTPDSLLNPVAGALVMAADGAWDGETWLHGAVGWRAPLPGWRAGFLGDFLGMPDRAHSHFNAYQKSQVTNVPATIPHPTQDPKANLARGIEQWGTQMYSNGYICRSPNDNKRTHHYDMNLNFVDELLWHFQFDADTAYLRQMWPLLKLHLEWEKRNWDPDNDHLFDAYCCIWASDALYYNGSAATHASAYNYRGFALAARIAEILGDDPTPYKTEAEAILKAMNQRLWVDGEGHWAEYQDYMGLKRVHKNAAVWSLYTPIDCEACTPEQAYSAMRWAESHYAHIPLSEGSSYYTIPTSDWQPYDWSTNNVAMAEVMHTALAYFQAGIPEVGYNLLKSNIIDFMYMGKSPANFGQISYYDAVLGESYRDFSDVSGIASRALLQGLFGITPNALYGQCILRPGLPSAWQEASVQTPYLSYSMKKKGGKVVYEVTQNFARPLTIVFRQNLGKGKYRDIVGTADKTQTFTVDDIDIHEDAREVNQAKEAANYYERMRSDGQTYDGVANGKVALVDPQTANTLIPSPSKTKAVDLKKYYNAVVEDIFKNEYLSPRPPFTSLELPKQGIGDWCSIKRTANIERKEPVVYTSLWDNYPDSVTMPLKGSGDALLLTLAGSTNQMQADIDNGYVKVMYADGTGVLLQLRNPDTWVPIEQDWRNDGLAFRLHGLSPMRKEFKTGRTARTLTEGSTTIDGGAATLLTIPINKSKRLKSLTLRTLSNDVVIGLMRVEILQR